MTTFTATQDAGQITVEGRWIDTFPVHDAWRRLALWQLYVTRDWPGYTQAADALRAAMGETA